MDDAAESDRLTPMLMLLSQVVDMAVAKYDNNCLLKALTLANRDLESRVEQRTRDLARANKTLEQEITERKASQLALGESEEKFRLISEQSLMGIMIVQDDEVIYVNQATSNLNGYTVEEMYKWGPKEFGMPIHPDDYEFVMAQGQKKQAAENGYVTHYQYRIITKSGKVKSIDQYSKPIIFKGKPADFITGIDITDRKAAEESLIENEEKYRSLFKNIADSVFIFDQESKRFLDCNQAAKDRYGYSLEELLNMTPYQLHPPQETKKVSQNIDDKENIVSHEYTHITKDGDRFPVEIKTNEINYRGQKAWISLVRDISERKQVEKERQRLEVQLQHAQKMEAIGTLAGGVAHDLNNILSGIVSYPDLLLMQLPDHSPLKKPISTIKESGQKAAAVVQDLLTLARRGVAVTEVVNLNTIITQYLQSPEYEKLISFHPAVTSKANLDKALLNIMGSPVHLSKTIMNLVSNAAEAMPEGGEIVISTENRYIDKPIKGYDAVDEGDYIVVTVADTGVGISAEERERIFEPFYTKKVMGKSGTGLGMAVVWGTVKDHKGYIDVQSVAGQGSTFSLYFPVTRKELSKDLRRLSIEDYRGNGESVLIIDDVKDQREIASIILVQLGYSVAVVSSGEEAVEYLQDNKADLLILDMIMDPGMNGLDTYRQIVKIHPRQKAIIASGFSETDRVRETQKLGAGQYIRKPYTLEKIGLAVKKELYGGPC